MAAIKNSLLLLLLLVLLHSSISAELEGNGIPRSPPSSPPSNWGVFDYYTLALQWSTSFCNQRKTCATTIKANFPKEFTIHGLWPSMNNGLDPEVSGETFDENKITPLLGRLANQWPDAKTYQYNDPTNASNYIDFWSSEWRKHGAATTKSIHDYFDSALDLHDTLKQVLLQVVKYKQGFTKDIDINQLLQGLFQNLGARPKVKCNYWRNNEQMFELHFKFDLSLKLVNASRGNCNSNTVLLP